MLSLDVFKSLKGTVIKWSQQRHAANHNWEHDETFSNSWAHGAPTSTQSMPKWRVTVAHHSYTVAEDGFGPARKSLGAAEVRCTCLKTGPRVGDDNLDGMGTKARRPSGCTQFRVRSCQICLEHSQFISIWGSKLVRIVRSTGRFLRRWIPPNCWLLEFGPCCCNSTQVILSHSFSICCHGSLILYHHKRKGQTTKVSKPCISRNNVRVTIGKFTIDGWCMWCKPSKYGSG